MKHNGPFGWKFWVGAVATGLLLVACDGVAPAAPASTAAATPAPTTGAGPHPSLTPPSGSLNTQLTLEGSGFPANAQIRIRLGDAAASREPQFIGEVLSNGDGRFRLVLLTPRAWPDGSPIVERTLVFYAATIDNAATTSATYTNTSGSDVTAPAQTPMQVQATTTTSAVGTAHAAIVLDPVSGAVNTTVTVRGKGFPAKRPVELRLGLPGAGVNAQVYANGEADNDGSFTLDFAIPASWPDGQPITQKTLVVVVSTPDNTAKALTEYALKPDGSSPTQATDATPATTPGLTTQPPVTRTVPVEGTGPASPDPIATSVDFLYSLLRDPTGASSVVYLSQRFRTEIANNWVLPTGLGIQPGYNSFEVVLLTKGEDSVVIQATLTYESGASIRNFTLIKEGGNWRIDQVVAGSR